MTTPAPLLLRALAMERVERRPLWLMRQAGRYLPEYRAVREKCGGFLAMATNPPVACEITLQPVKRFGMDAAIIFSDILTIPDAMGLGLHFIDGEGPKLRNPLRDEKAVDGLPTSAADDLEYVYDACRLVVDELAADDIPLVGFCGSPWTLACYMIDGGGGGFWHARRMLYARPDLLHKILAANAKAAAGLLCGQLAAGCRAVMIFDSWGGLLGGDDYQTFSLRYIGDIVNAVKGSYPDAPVIVFARQCHHHLAALAGCGCDAVGVDWHIPMSKAREVAGKVAPGGGAVALQGNMDPAVLLTDEKTVRREALRILNDYGNAPGHIFNLGHGVDKNTPPQNVAALADAVRNLQLL